MAWKWIERRRITLVLVGFFAAWYLAQLVVASACGTKTAVWWFYFAGNPSPGYVLAPVSHNIADIGHLQRNATMLLITGALAEPYLNRQQYAALLLGIAFASIVVANALSLAVGTPWAPAGPSGGIYGLWAYIGIRNRSFILDSDGWKASVEAVFVLAGVLLLAFVPVFDVYTTGAVNVSHVAGILLGYVVALAETPPQVGALPGE